MNRGQIMCYLQRVTCRLTAAVWAPNIPLTAGRVRLACPEAHVCCACDSSGAAAWSDGLGTGARGRGGRRADDSGREPDRRRGSRHGGRQLSGEARSGCW